MRIRSMKSLTHCWRQDKKEMLEKTEMIRKIEESYLQPQQVCMEELAMSLRVRLDREF